MFLGTRPASGTRIGTATWPYNAQPVLLKNSTRSRPQGRNADNPSNWITSEWPTNLALRLSQRLVQKLGPVKDM
jgi:hypothetical protein